MPAKAIKLRCVTCNELKRVEEFGWSKKNRAPTKSCKKCWTDPSKNRQIIGGETTEEMLLYYAPIRRLMVEINEAQADAIANDLPVDRPIAALGDVFVGEMTEEVYKAIVQALIRKASSGDTRAAELLLKERNARAGDPTPKDVEESWEDLFKVDPLKPGMDTE